MIECPTCDDTFDTEHGMKVHHTFAHGESLAKQDCTCETCGDTFQEFQSRIERGKGCFCSKECKHRQGRIDVECETCGDTIEKPEHRAERYSRHFCSKECYLETRAPEMQDTENHPTYEGGPETVECENCGDEISLYKHHIRERNFCSVECSGEYHRGQNNPRWREDAPAGSYRGGWHTARRKALGRAEYACEHCGMTEEEHYSEYGISLDVHHEIPYRTFDDPEEAHKPSNLTVLCRACHMQEEWAGDESSTSV